MKIVVVGGVGGGMGCAARARRLDETAEIVVLDRGEHVSFANCGLPYFVGGEMNAVDSLLVQTPASLKAALNLDVRVRHDVVGLDTAARRLAVRTPDGEQVMEYDALVLSPGQQAMRPPIPGLDSPRVQTLRTIQDAVALRELAIGPGSSGMPDGAAASPQSAAGDATRPGDEATRHAVVLGAGFIGLEAAEALITRGLKVAVVEMADHVLPPLESEMAVYVANELRRMGATVYAGVAASEVIPGTAAASDVVVLANGTKLPADVIVLSVGGRPDTAVFEAAGIACERGAIVVDEHGRTSAAGVWAVGDAVVSTDGVTGARRPIPLAGPANRAGRLVADHIVRGDAARAIPAPLGTAIVRVGAVTAAMTGANRSSLRAAGIDFVTLHGHPGHHAGWFPGAQTIHLMVHIGTDGRLLGAQAVGGPGVDKRIDVLATAIRGGLSVGDLIDLDLCYSPPYGSAKDPVNLMGLVGTNVLDGTLKLWYAEDLAAVQAGALVLDVRSAAEFATGHIPGSLNIPHTQLRERLPEVQAAAAGRPVRVLCASGVRSHIAHRVLTQAGYDSASLSGGIQTLRAVLGDRAGEVLVRG